MNQELKIGIIGFDTSHVPAFTKLLNDTTDPFHVPGARVVAGFPSFSSDLEGSRAQAAQHTREVQEKFGVEIVESIAEVIARSDAILLESIDGRRHLEEARPVIAACKPLFIDKPLAANYHDAVEIVRLANENNCPLFSASSLRFDANIAAIKADAGLGRVLACDAFSPATLELANPGLFWYGIHGVEILYTFMGRGCRGVLCQSSDDYHLVTAHWTDGRIATLRGTRCGVHEYGVTVFGEKKVAWTLYSRDIPIYGQLLQQIVPFFRGEQAPVPIEETLEMMAFMQAALVSEEEGREVALNEITED